MAFTKIGDISQTTGVNYSGHLGEAPTPQMHTKPIVGMVTKEKSVKGDKVVDSTAESELVHPGVAFTGMSVTVEGGRTINLGNYESARIGVTLTVPCEKDTLNEMFEWATNWVSEKIEEAVNSAKA